MKFFYSLIIFFICSFASFFLLNGEYIQSNDFVLLVVVSLIVALVAPNFSEIQELSIGGNIVKLKEAKMELQVTIEQLKMIKISTFRMLLLKSLHFSGGFGSTYLVDERLEYFISLIDEIKEADCFNDLKQEIKGPLKELTITQLNKFHAFFKNEKFTSGSNYPKPMYFYVELTKEIIDLVHANQRPVIPYEKKKEEIILAINAYAKLYLLIGEIES